MSPSEKSQVNLSASRALMYIGNVSTCESQMDWTAMEKAAREAIQELQLLVTVLVTASDRSKGPSK